MAHRKQNEAMILYLQSVINKLLFFRETSCYFLEKLLDTSDIEMYNTIC